MHETITNPEFDETMFRRELMEIAPATRRYLIVFTPRSGSTWLTTVLMSTGRHGQPREYLNEEFLGNRLRFLNAFDNHSLVEMLLRKRQTANGVFGLRATSTQIRAFGEDLLFRGLGPEALVYTLERENIVAQGLSLYRAVETKRFHSNQDVASAMPPYDAKKIRWWISHILEIERENRAMLERRGLDAWPIRYETLAPDRDRALAAFAEVAGPEPETPPQATAADLAKVGDSWNEEVEARFRSTEGRFLKTVAAKRRLNR